MTFFISYNLSSFWFQPGQSRDVFDNMAEDFMKPVIDIVDQLLAANVSVTVYNGQLDLIVDTMGKGLLDWGWEQHMWKVKCEVASNVGTWICPVFCANLPPTWQLLNTTVRSEQLLVCFVYIPLR